MVSLPCRSINDSAERTILLLHGGNSSSAGWNPVIEHLTDYHLLVPDLHHSPDIAETWSFAVLAPLLADIITSKAHAKQVDLVGFSMGGYLAVFFAAKHSHLVRDIFLSGCHHSFKRYTSLGLVLGLGDFFQAAAPKSAFLFFADKIAKQKNGQDMYTDTHANKKAGGAFQRGRVIASAIGTEVPQSVWEKVTNRTLLVAGADEWELSRMKINAAWLQKGNSESRAAIVPEQGHVWDTSEPALFAQGVVAWFERKELPARYEAVQ